MARYDFSEVQNVELGAANDNGVSLYNLGMMYSTGRTVEQDLVSAHKWFNLAAMQGNDDAREYRMEIARELSDHDIADAQRLARQWLHAH